MLFLYLLDGFYGYISVEIKSDFFIATSITLSNGVPIETVSKMLGHSSLETTQIYAKIVDSKISNDMNHVNEH